MAGPGRGQATSFLLPQSCCQWPQLKQLLPVQQALLCPSPCRCPLCCSVVSLCGSSAMCEENIFREVGVAPLCQNLKVVWP